MKHLVLGVAPFVLGVTMSVAPAFLPNARADEEWEQFTPYYEDDAWYDVSEWFDGNDYNPTDEMVGRWDNETYDVAEDRGGDFDNDWSNYGYGYYDYGDLDAGNDLYEYSYRYYDYDNDGFYDAMASLYDRDRDGFYEDVDFAWFSDVSPKRQQETQKQFQDRASRSSRASAVTGTIQDTKVVRMNRFGKEHLVVTLRQADGGKVNADLGPRKAIDQFKLKEGENITVRGPMSQIGNTRILLAKSLEANGKQTDLQSAQRTFQGKITDMREVKLRGHKNRIVILDSQAKPGEKLAVDLGPVDKLGFAPSKGDPITVTGAPIKFKGKSLVMASSVKHNGQQVAIQRQKGTAAAGEPAREAAKEREPGRF